MLCTQIRVDEHTEGNFWVYNCNKHTRCGAPKYVCVCVFVCYITNDVAKDSGGWQENVHCNSKLGILLMLNVCSWFHHGISW